TRMQSLSQHQAIERIGRKIARLGQVPDDGRTRVIRRNVQDVLMLDPRATKSPTVRVVADLKYPAADVCSMAVQELFDVITINGRSPIEAKINTDGRNPIKIAKTDRAKRRWRPFPLQAFESIDHGLRQEAC